MNIDFSKDISYWVDLVKQFLDIIADAFSWFNIDLFKKAE